MKTRRFLILLAALIFVFLFSACQQAPVEKKIIMSQNTWPEYTFEEACDEAARIVIGTVKSVNRTYLSVILEDPLLEYGYTVLDIEVEETLKGEHQDIVEYTQDGCETEDRIFRSHDAALSEGDHVLVFIGKNGLMLNPSFLRGIDADGNIVTAKFPEGYVPEAEMNINGYAEIGVGEYAGLIRDYLAG